MCGIAGIFNRDGSPVDLELLKRMADSMSLRGPDGEGFHTDGSFGLAHRRLSIIDPAGGAQPISNESDTIFIVVNGEIYNFPELRKFLEAKGHCFKTDSDSECALHAYEEYGKDFVLHLDGMFAIAVYDSEKRKLILARDRAGEKPLFFILNDNFFAFSSCLNALKLIPDVPLTLSEDALWEYLSFQYVSHGTLFGCIDKLSPAECFEIGEESALPVRTTFWSPRSHPATGVSFPDAAKHLRELVTDSVRRCLVSDVPLGIFLSGGLDSTIIAAVASRFPGNEPLKCFSIGFDDPAYDESAQAKINADYICAHAARPVEFHHRIVCPNDFDVLKKVLSFYGQPYADSSILPTFQLCRFARENVTVALSGDGADELFGGYERYLVMKNLSKLDWIPQKLRAALLLPSASAFPNAGGDRTKPARLKRLLIAASGTPDARYLSMISAFSESEKKQLCRFDCSKQFLENFSPHHDSASMFDMMNYLPNDILVKTDTASMSNSLEVRAPFLSHAILDFALALPDSYKMRGMNRKVILSEAFRGYYPPGLERMRKRGFGIPVAAWMRGPWKEYLRSYLLDGKGANEYGLFHREFLEKLIREHCENRADHSKKLYALLAFELSFAEFRSQKTPPS